MQNHGQRQQQQPQQWANRERRAAKLREATQQHRALARASALEAARAARARGEDAREAAAAAVASAVRGSGGGGSCDGGGNGGNRQNQDQNHFASDEQQAIDPSFWDPDEWARLEAEIVEESLAQEAEEHATREAAALDELVETHQGFNAPSKDAPVYPPPLPQLVPPAGEVARGTCPLCGVKGALAATAGGSLACSAAAFAAFRDFDDGDGGAPFSSSSSSCSFSVSSAARGPGDNAPPTPSELASAIAAAERAHAATGCPERNTRRTLLAATTAATESNDGGNGGGGTRGGGGTLLLSCHRCGAAEVIF